MNAWTNFWAAPPRMKPMANPATPRSRIKSTNPVNCPRICSRISLFCSINGLIDKTVGFRILRSRDVDECNVWEVRDQKIVHFYILRPEAFFFHLICVGEQIGRASWRGRGENL